MLKVRNRNNIELAQATIDAILSILGDPKHFNEGYKISGNTQGQIVEEYNGIKRYTSKIINYTAKVITKHNQSEWSIVDFEII